MHDSISMFSTAARARGENIFIYCKRKSKPKCEIICRMVRCLVLICISIDSILSKKKKVIELLWDYFDTINYHGKFSEVKFHFKFSLEFSNIYDILKPSKLNYNVLQIERKDRNFRRFGNIKMRIEFCLQFINNNFAINK